jgi:Ice-binding-like
MSRFRVLVLSAPCLAVATLALVGSGSPASAAQAQVGLGTATSFAVLGGSTVTNTGPTTISGDVGLAPGNAVVGFPPGLVTGGSIHAADAVALQAQNDLTTAFNDAAGRGPVIDETGVDLGGQTLLPGVYNASTSMALTGTVTLDGLGDPAAVFIFQAGSTLISASNATVSLVGAAQPCNVFWQVGSSATIGTNTTFVGSVLALTSITMQTGASIQGRLLARNGQVALDTNVINRPSCAAVPPPATATPTPTASVTPSTGATSTPHPHTSGTGGSGSGGSGSGSGGSGSGGSGSGSGGSGSGTDTGTGTGTPVIPPGHPETGRLPGGERDSQLWLLGALACAGAAGATVVGSTRRRSSLRLP